MSVPQIALVFSPEPWVEALHRHCTDHGGARIRQLVLDPALLMDEPFDVLVVSHRWPSLTPALVRELHARERRVLGVYDREEPAGRDLLADLSADAVVASDAAPRELVDALVALGSEAGEPSTAASEAIAVGAEQPRRAAVVAVGGPAGAGTTEVALHLAASRHARDLATVLVDADETAPVVATRLALPVEPNLRSAVDAVEHGMGDLEECLLRVPAGGFGAVVGLPSAASWEQLRPGEVLRVVAALGACHDRIVVDTSAPIEDVRGRGRGRFATTRAVLAEADVVVAVCHGTPVGVVRLLTWVADLRGFAPRVALRVLVNEAPPDRFRRGELHEEISRTLPDVEIAFAPRDRRVAEAAWRGDVARRGPFADAVDATAAELATVTGVGAPTRSARPWSRRRRTTGRRPVEVAPT